MYIYSPSLLYNVFQNIFLSIFQEYSTTVNSRDNKSYNNDSKHRNGGTANKTNNHTANR